MPYRLTLTLVVVAFMGAIMSIANAQTRTLPASEPFPWVQAISALVTIVTGVLAWLASRDARGAKTEAEGAKAEAVGAKTEAKELHETFNSKMDEMIKLKVAEAVVAERVRADTAAVVAATAAVATAAAVEAAKIVATKKRKR